MSQILIGPGVLFWAEVPELPTPGEIVLIDGIGINSGFYELRQAPQDWRWNGVLYPSYSRRHIAREPVGEKTKTISVEVLYP